VTAGLPARRFLFRRLVRHADVRRSSTSSGTTDRAMLKEAEMLKPDAFFAQSG